MCLVAVDTAELANFPHTSSAWVGLWVTYGDTMISTSIFILPNCFLNLTSKLTIDVAQNAFRARYIYHIII